MSNRNSRRIQNSSAYMGAGNRASVFNQKARKPFEEVADIYKKEIQKKGDKNSRAIFKELSVLEKQIIKTRIKKQERKKKIQSVYILIASIILGVIGLLIIGIAIRYFFFHDASY